MSYHSGDDVYIFSTYDGYTSTIWDAGGVDAIQANTEGTIDLRPGHFSTIGGKSIGIAYGVTIENAYGSSLTDTIIGNDADNLIRSNGGADTLSGGLGNDTYVILGSATVIEAPGEGIDAVQIDTGADYTLPANVENLQLLG